ncbi:zinc knuckle (CCHC-type) family protein [Thalictrum thalictroides]|uniref:Zinc knuckle (CCHC-type) family protein n=1 Tax=Thalictrum thalictroides TaxID=46969 RepID=A0A7J6X327_THATH|nr:zinc knuckle (CCHC-type) family protein [Thalictrum thalictroides]
MFSVCSPFRFLQLQCRRKEPNFWVFIHSEPKISSFISCTSSSSKNEDSSLIPNRIQVDYNPSDEFYGIEVDMKPRDSSSGALQQKSWFGPNGQYIRELPCPSCRGRGYTPCTECDIERSRSDCSQCHGKGIRTCQQCVGECVIWQEAIDERPWERARSISPLKVKEDDDVDKLDIKLEVRKKSRRVYQSPNPEVGLKISRSLKSLNERTGLFSKHMKILHRDPKLHAQRVAAIKKTKGTEAARKQTSETLKAFFRDPENRRRRSISMKGVKYYCRNCGREGHRRNYCPELIKDSSVDRRFRCRLCGQRGHNRRTCHNSRPSESKVRVIRLRQCRVCGCSGHNRRTCNQATEIIPSNVWLPPERRSYSCRLCHGKGHNRRTCPSVKKKLPES